eukprot:Blabericola_migrator_1__9010@NODE_479_length_8179_cov_106_519354_g373_i0_p9_GENE_NODE_479_length_8179_cov_106_519354_g373_i0NODE_479_length_8179_cov_106_519354_g373_i0_p9_ORF_typecomplete_len115_score18_71_NODE_479_length_8179_cov_106_519354_g373_i024692813
MHKLPLTITTRSLFQPDAACKSYWFGPRVRSNSKQNEFWIHLLDKLINFVPLKTEDGHTTRSSCQLLASIEQELVDLFKNPDLEGTQLKAQLSLLQSELLELQEFVLAHASQKQ